MRPCLFPLIALLCLVPLARAAAPAAATKPGRIEGWTLLSAEPRVAAEAIKASAAYGINHLQLSHDLMMNLPEARDPAVAARINRLADEAHAAGIGEVCVWDHALYHAGYYPERFRSAPGGLIDLDNPEFWEWLKADYRQTLDLLPKIDGVILTFIETGTFVEDQYSTRMKSEAEKLAHLQPHLFSDVLLPPPHRRAGGRDHQAGEAGGSAPKVSGLRAKAGPGSAWPRSGAVTEKVPNQESVPSVVKKRPPPPRLGSLPGSTR